MNFLLRLLLVVAASGCIMGARLATRHYLGQHAEAGRPGAHAGVGGPQLLTQFP